MIWSTRSDWRVQQIQPFCIPTMASSLWIRDVWSIRLLSMFSSAMSFTMTAHLNSSSVCLVSRMCLSKVVFPEPRNPQSRVTGIKPSADPDWWTLTSHQMSKKIIKSLTVSSPPPPMFQFLVVHSSVCDATFVTWNAWSAVLGESLDWRAHAQKNVPLQGLPY